MPVSMIGRLSQTHLSILRKLYQNSTLSSKGEISKVGLTRVGMEKKLGLNRRTLGFNLGILTHYGLLIRKEIIHGEQTWNYYAVSPVGEFVILREMGLRQFGLRELSKFSRSIPLIERHWKSLVQSQLYQFPIRSLLNALSSVEYNILSEQRIPHSIVSINLTLPYLQGNTAFTLRKIFGLFFVKEKEIPKDETSWEDHTPIIGMATEFLKKSQSQESNFDTMQKISNSLKDYVTFAFYYYLFVEFEYLLFALEQIKKSDLSDDEKFERLKDEANDILAPLGHLFTQNDRKTLEEDVKKYCFESIAYVSKRIRKDHDLVDLIKNILGEFKFKEDNMPNFIGQLLER